jgi:ATP-binding cassette subfamily F protein uup
VGILISCQNISKSFGSRPLFEHLSFGLMDGERTGLIGPNGTGKSTLLKILAGLEKVDEGMVSPHRGLHVGYLEQTDRFENQDQGLTVRAALYNALKDLGLEDYELDARITDGLQAAGCKDEEQDITQLSGGWRKRLAILMQVLREPDLLLLDEPTNHLDLEGVLWLEKYLSQQRFSFLVVTHDRRFLERVTNRIIELNKRYPEGAFSCEGNYSRFLEKREELFNSQARREDTAANQARREIEWLRRGPKARQCKQQARIDRAGELMEDLEELKYRNSQGRSVDIAFMGSQRQTKCLVEAKEIAITRGGRKLFGPLNLMLSPGDKLGLLGENGSGKSTLLKLLAGELTPDHGTVKQAEKLKVVTFDQHRDQLDLSLSLKEALCETGDYVRYRGNAVHVAGWAARFLFTKDQLESPLSRMSGGEQSRVLIARLMLQPADLLLLDEPTNDLDIASLEVLEQSLSDFPGALVLVTHDRYLLDRVSQSILALDNQGNADYFADLAQWEDWREAKRSEAKNKERQERNNKGNQGEGRKKALSTKELNELKGMEDAIHDAENKLKMAQAQLHNPTFAADPFKLVELQKAVDAGQDKVDRLFKRWEELEAKKKAGESSSLS